MTVRVAAGLWFVLALTTLWLLVTGGHVVLVALAAWAGGLVTRQVWRSLREAR